MGWWNANEKGGIAGGQDTGMLWGDGPADEMDRAISNIQELFLGAVQRKPTVAELRAGLEFALAGEPEVEKEK